MQKKGTILITGAAGFIGYHLCLKMLKEEYTVIGLDNINNYYDIRIKYGRLENLGISKNEIISDEKTESTNYKKFKFIKLDIKEKHKLEHFFKNEKIDYVVNLAAQAGVRYSIENPDAYLESNVIGFYNILECSKKFNIKHLVYASSSSVYGSNEKLPFSTSDNVDHPVSLYAASKKSNELFAHSYSHLYNLPTTGLRFFTVYGPWGRPDMALFLFVNAIIKGNSIDVYNYGKMKRDFTYIDDIVEGIFRVLENKPKSNDKWSGKKPDPAYSKAPYRIFNIGNNNPVQLLDFIKMIEEKIGKKANMNLLPLQPGDVPASHAEVSDLIRELQYNPSTSIEYGISNFVDWYKSYYKITL